ncbi:unnamed protein product [Didymodactylos carnosus]|uniref:Kinesin light chain n=1 Tax=Didymodactylos carnosus TaxID=1234261 RepID=A0A8S2DJM8_9BILA|nr:unnamed protein product [Didymodactylos carnosus]CAF3756643.1 unnamed protein product [Didymodactylos carnosus]
MACEIYAGSGNNRTNSTEESILFEIEADTCLEGAKPFGDITERSAFDKEEHEILFMLGSVFKIVDILSDEQEKLWTVKLKLSSEGVGNYKNAYLNYSKALELELQKPLLHKYNLGNIFTGLGHVLKQQGQFDRALSQYVNVLKLDLGEEGRHGILLGAAYLNIGGIHYDQGNYELALENMFECLGIQLRQLPENHPDVARTLNYIALAQQSAGECELALTNYRRALSIQLACNLKHPETAITYNSIGMVYVKGFKNCTEAMVNYEKALKIYENAAFPSNHPALIPLLTNIGQVHRLREDYELAMSYYNRALHSQLENASNHAHAAVIYSNIALIYDEGYQNYPETLINYSKAAEISRLSMPEDRPDFAKILLNMGNLYTRMLEYEMALTNYRNALSIELIHSLDRPDTAALCNRIGAIYGHGLKNYRKALIDFEKALTIHLFKCPITGPSSPRTK